MVHRALTSTASLTVATSRARLLADGRRSDAEERRDLSWAVNSSWPVAISGRGCLCGVEGAADESSCSRWQQRPPRADDGAHPRDVPAAE
eukprot:3929515-Prymnesium_polylepis.1